MMSWQIISLMVTVLSGWSLALEATTLSLNKEWPASKLITVDAGFLSVKVEGEERQTIEASSVLENLGKEASYEWQVNEDEEELRLRLVATNIPHYNIDGTLTLKVPQKTSVRINNSSGDVWVHHLKSKEVAIKTASGDITFQDCTGVIKANSASGEINASRLQGTLKFRNVSGDLHLNNLEGAIFSRTTSGQTEGYHLQGDVEIEASCGSVNIEDLQGDLEVETRSGPIKARGIRSTDEVNLRSITGSIYLTMAQPLNEFSVQMNSETGTVVVQKQNMGRKFQQDKVDLPGAPKIKMVTISGSIQLDEGEKSGL